MRVASLDEQAPAAAPAMAGRRSSTPRNLLLLVAALVVVVGIIVAVLISRASKPASTAPGLLRVTTTQGLPTQILVDGQIGDTAGLNWLKVAAGSHTVCFSHVEGWNEPPCQTVSVTAGVTSTVNGSFTQRGILHVITSPAVPSQIKVDGNPTNDFSFWTDIPTGSHSVCFGAVADYTPPPCQTAAVTSGQLTTITGAFRTLPGAHGPSGLGQLSVGTAPSLPVQIMIKPPAGSEYIADSWRLNDLELTPGSYTVRFSHVLGYTEPAPRPISIRQGEKTTITGTFAPRGTLQVITSPEAASTIEVDGVPRDDFRLSTEFPVGSHKICFGNAPKFATAPGCQTVVVTAGGHTTVTGHFH